MNKKLVKLGKLKFGLSIIIYKNVMYANFGDPKSRDCELKHQKFGKNGNFCVEHLLICL